jgi:hypothetical protein
VDEDAWTAAPLGRHEDLDRSADVRGQEAEDRGGGPAREHGARHRQQRRPLAPERRQQRCPDGEDAAVLRMQMSAADPALPLTTRDAQRAQLPDRDQVLLRPGDLGDTPVDVEIVPPDRGVRSGGTFSVKVTEKVPLAGWGGGEGTFSAARHGPTVAQARGHAVRSRSFGTHPRAFSAGAPASRSPARA